MLITSKNELFIDKIIKKYTNLPIEDYKNLFINFRSAMVNDKTHVFMLFDEEYIYFTSSDFQDKTLKNKHILKMVINKYEYSDPKFSEHNAKIMDLIYPSYILDEQYPLIKEQDLFLEQYLNIDFYPLFKKAVIDSLILFKKEYYDYFMQEDIDMLNYNDLTQKQIYIKFSKMILNTISYINSKDDRLLFDLICNKSQTNNKLLWFYFNYFENISKEIFMNNLSDYNQFKGDDLAVNYSSLKSYYEKYKYMMTLQKFRKKYGND